MTVQPQKVLKAVTNLNWAVFGLVFLTTGLFAIYGTAGWAWLAFGLWWVFGLTCVSVWGVKAQIEREEN